MTTGKGGELDWHSGGQKSGELSFEGIAPQLAMLRAIPFFFFGF